MRHHRGSRGLIAFARRHRVATTFLCLFLMSSPARPDDRQLLQANSGANTNVLIILDSSNSMNRDFNDQYTLPAFMDDFIYPEGTVATEGSKFGVAKSVLREVLTKTAGVNWAFSYYRNPQQTFGAAGTAWSGSAGKTGYPVGGATKKNDHLENGGLEWLYFADSIYPTNDDISSVFTAAEYPDIQQGRFLQMGHRVMHNYGTQGWPETWHETDPSTLTPPVVPYAANKADTRPPYDVSGTTPGAWRGAFGPIGLNEGTVIYRSATLAKRELRMKMVQGNYSDPFVVVQIDEYGPIPDTPTNTATNTPTFTPSNTSTNTPSNTPTTTNTNTPSNTSTQTSTPTPTSTSTQTSTQTPTKTSTVTNTPSQTNTSSPTNTPSNTATRTPTFTASTTNTPSNTATQTSTRTSTRTFTVTNTPSQTNTPSVTNTPSFTPTRTPTFTATRTFTATNTFTATRTFTVTNTPSRTNTPSNTATRTATNTPSQTNTPSNTPSLTNTASHTATRTATNTPSITNTPSLTATQTATRTFTATSTFTRTSTVTNTPSNTATNTPSNTNTPTFTNTATFTSSRTATNTATFTPTNTPTKTPTLVPTLPGGAMPRPSLLPAIAKWFAPVVRGLFAMAPPPPPDSPCSTVSGIPSAYGGASLLCGPCQWQSIVPPPFQEFNKPKTCAYYDVNGNGQFDPGVDYSPMWEPDTTIDPSYGINPLPTSPSFSRGFDNPQADPDLTFIPTGRTVQIKYVRGDLYDLPPDYQPNDVTNGNPPWGSCPTATTQCPAAPDNDADGKADTSTINDRHNQGMFSSSVNSTYGGFEPNRPVQQYPNDAFAGPSCPLRGPGSCDPYSQDCGGFAHFNDFTTVAGTNFSGVAPDALLNPVSAGNPHIYQTDPPAAPETWPVVPFKREWISSDYPAGTSPEDAIKRLLRFTSSIVGYNSGATADQAYTLAEDAKEVVVTAIGTPVAGVLRDAYNYFVNAVFPPASNYPWTGSGNKPAPDPSIDCRKYIIVYITDGKDECGADNAICTGGTISGAGPAGDLGEVLLPESAAGRRALAASLDPNVKTKGVPVFVVALTQDPTFQATLQCIADLSGGQYFQATDRATLASQLQFILDFKRNANFFASPAVPAFAGGIGDTAQIGAVIPSHLNTNGDLSSWSIWSGSLKSFQLDSNGQIPVVTGTATTPVPTDTPGGPTPTPGSATPTPTPSLTYPDETDPNNPSEIARKPVWNAGRVLGFTDPKADLAASAVPVPANPSGRAPAITVWPGRKMVWANGTTGVPRPRADFMPNSGSCTGTCWDNLMTNMNLLPIANGANQTKGLLTVQFLRGGISSYGSRDEVLNDASVKPPTITLAIGPAAGQEQKYSYFYQDDAPQPGDPPQVRTDDDGSPPAGYAHKLGDIFHSEPFLVEPPRYFQYLSGNLTPRTSSSTFGEPYLDFATRNSKRRKVLFVGSNDGFMHAFDSGVWGRDAVNFPSSFDLGTGREIFAYAPRMVMPNKFPSLLDFQPQPQYFVDGSPTAADVFIDPEFVGSPDPTERVWRTVVVGGLRQGGAGYFALDVTQPDDIDTNTASATYGEIVGNKDASPGCLDGGATSCSAGASSNRQYPSIMWEMADAGALCTDTCPQTSAPASMGETWSRPVIGRIKVHDPLSTTSDSNGFDDRYVAIFGGGFDPAFTPGDSVALRLPKGRAFYMVDIETGKILYKTTQGEDAGGNPVNFAPMPSAPAVADFNDDGYLDVVYIGDVNGQMWRINLTPDGTTIGEIQPDGQSHGYAPFLLFDGCEPTAGVCTQNQPIFYEPGIVFVGGGATTPALGVAWGTGNRAELAKDNLAPAGFFYVNDSGSTGTTFKTSDLHDLTPPTGTPCALPYSGACANAINGFHLVFETPNEKTTSTVFSTQGYLSLVTFTADSVSPCETNGSSFRYRFFFLTGQGAYGSNGNYTDYRESLGKNMASATQSTSPQGDIIDTVLFSGGGIRQDVTPGSIRSIEQNWKEQQ